MKETVAKPLRIKPTSPKSPFLCPLKPASVTLRVQLGSVAAYWETSVSVNLMWQGTAVTGVQLKVQFWASWLSWYVAKEKKTKKKTWCFTVLLF